MNIRFLSRELPKVSLESIFTLSDFIEIFCANNNSVRVIIETLSGDEFRAILSESTDISFNF